MNLDNEGEAFLCFRIYLERREASSLFSEDLGAMRLGGRREKSRHPLSLVKTKKRVMEERKIVNTCLITRSIINLI